MYGSPYEDFEGSRAEFLKCLAEQGEVPAFLRRAQSVDEALVKLLEQCKSQRAVMLRWPWMHLCILADRLSHDWSLLGPYLADNRHVTCFEHLYVEWKVLLEAKAVSSNAWRSTPRILRDFVEAVQRFNKAWNKFLVDLNLEDINHLRRDFNTHYPVEKACAFASEDVERLGFTPLDPVTIEQLHAEFPPVALPALQIQ